MNYTEHQLRIFRDRYAHGNEEYPHEMFKRVAHAVANAETSSGARVISQSHFEHLLSDFRYLPAGRILAAMGTGAKVTAQNCYVIPSPEDSRGGILHSLGEWTEIQARGGGVGINISSLRPRGELVKSVQGTSSGPVNWAQMFAFMSHSIIQQGGSRRGAAMIMMNDDHPDIFEFINAKKTPGMLEGCNMSVCISNDFMNAVDNNWRWELKWGGKVYEVVEARDLWNKIIDAAWSSAEPGIYFMERANEQANSGYFEELISTNPCGEQPLGPYGACLLGSLNLAAFITEGENGKVFDTAEFVRCAKSAVRFNDNVIDLSYYPLPECEESQQRIRRMGIGVMGLADLLLALEIRYGSDRAIGLTEFIFAKLKVATYEASIELARERGSFPAFSAEEFVQRPFIQALPLYLRKDIREVGIRNCYLTSQAPTGTIAILAGVNSGIEPYFDFSYLRSDRTGDHQYDTDWAEMYASPDRPDWLVSSNDISPEDHILMQAAAQRHVDSSISKTVNAPESHTREDVDRTYMMAWKEGLKSISYYRDNSRREQVLYHKETPKEEEVMTVFSFPPETVLSNGDQIEITTSFTMGLSPDPLRLPDERPAIVKRFQVDGLTAFLTVGLFPETNNPAELFVTMSKQGSTLQGLMDAWAIQTSKLLQLGQPVEGVFNKFVGTKFEPHGMTSDKKVPTASSVLDYIARYMIMRFTGSGTPIPITVSSKPVDIPVRSRSGDFCPECGDSLYRHDGCLACFNPNCFYSKCG